MSEDVVKIAGLEMFGLTKHLPNKTMQFIRTNTFKYKFDCKYDFIFTNPPYGGDKSEKNSQILKNEKILDYISNQLNIIKKELKSNPKDKKLLDKEKEILLQIEKIKTILANEKKNQDEKKVNDKTCSLQIREFIKNNNLKNCNDKESCSLVLLMMLLNDNGVCVGVLKEGIFFDKKYNSIRKFLIENFNVKYVISIPQDQFENTSTKTSIIIFENTKEKTKEIIFYDLLVEKEQNDVFEYINKEYQLTKNKDDILKVIEKEICKCKVTDINNNYSLNFKNYLKNNIVIQKGFSLIKLGDLIKYEKKSKRKAGEALEEGSYNFYTSSEKIKKCNDNDYKNNYCIILGTGGKHSLFMDKNFSCSADNFVFNTDNLIKTMYIYNYLKNTWNTFVFNLSNGTTLSHINKENLGNYEIPYPNDETMKK